MRNNFLLLIALLAFSSCSVLNPEQMLRTPKGFHYSSLEELLVTDQYRLAPNDEIAFQLFTNDGERLIDPITMLSGQSMRQQQLTYRVEFDGSIKLPVLGRTQVAGLTTRAAEVMLEEAFTEFYNRPFVQLRVVNNRVILFPEGEAAPRV